MDQDRYARLERIAALKDRGAISDEEFEREKRLILDEASTQGALVESLTANGDSPESRNRKPLWLLGSALAIGAVATLTAHLSGVNLADLRPDENLTVKASPAASPASPPSVRQMLEQSDEKVCVNVDVKDTLLDAISENHFRQNRDHLNVISQKLYDTNAQLSGIVAQGVEPQITKIRCSSTLVVGSIPFPLNYSVSPSLDNDQGFIVAYEMARTDSEGLVGLGAAASDPLYSLLFRAKLGKAPRSSQIEPGVPTNDAAAAAAAAAAYAAASAAAEPASPKAPHQSDGDTSQTDQPAETDHHFH